MTVVIVTVCADPAAPGWLSVAAVGDWTEAMVVPRPTEHRNPVAEARATADIVTVVELTNVMVAPAGMTLYCGPPVVGVTFRGLMTRPVSAAVKLAVALVTVADPELNTASSTFLGASMFVPVTEAPTSFCVKAAVMLVSDVLEITASVTVRAAGPWKTMS
jgi:hypothetical protein